MKAVVFVGKRGTLFTVILEHFDVVVVLDHPAAAVVHLLLLQCSQPWNHNELPFPTPDPGNAIHPPVSLIQLPQRTHIHALSPRYKHTSVDTCFVFGSFTPLPPKPPVLASYSPFFLINLLVKVRVGSFSYSSISLSFAI